MTEYVVNLNNEIGTSGYKPVFLFCYSGRRSSHCTYHIVEKENMGYPDKNQYGKYTAYDNCKICNIDWRNSSWHRSVHEWTFTGRDGATYRVWQKEDKSFWYQISITPPPPPPPPPPSLPTLYVINTQKNLKGTVEKNSIGVLWHITAPIVKDVWYGIQEDIPATWIDENGNEQMAVLRPSNSVAYLDRDLTGAIGETEVQVSNVEIISSAPGYTTQIRYPKSITPPGGCVEGTTRSVPCIKDPTKSVLQKCTGGMWVTIDVSQCKKEPIVDNNIIIAIVIIAVLSFLILKK